MAEFDLEQFIQNLIEAVVWCQHHLKEDSDPSVLWAATDEHISYTSRDHERVEPFYRRVIAARSKQVSRLPIPEYEDLLPLIQEGGLVIFFYTCTLSDGAAEVESRGFYDGFNCPPEITWIYHIDQNFDPNTVRYLIGWVPSQFLRDANNGIDTCPDESIVWLTEMQWLSYEKLLKAAYLWV